MNFANLKIGTRLGLGFALILVILAVIAGVGIGRLSSLDDKVTDLSDNHIPKLLAENEWIIAMLQTARQTRNILILDDPEKIKQEIEGINKLKEKRRELMERLQKTIVTPQGKAALQKVIDSRAAYTPFEDEFLKLAAAGDLAGAKSVLLEKARPAQLAYIDELYKLIDTQKDLISKASEAAHHDYSYGRGIMFALLAGALLLGAGYSVFVTRSITRPIDEAVRVAETVAAGDLTSRIEVRSTDEAGKLLLALKNMNGALANIVREVRGGTETIASASQQIASGNADLSSRTEEQASSLEETASSMEELTSTVKQNADNARQANQLAVSASEVAAKGGAVVSEVVDTMGAINESARKIVDIIAVIDGIAFQTNILALNAAVEAARAGEQGRGFAVVASEVRNLAQRSAAAAKEIKVLIDNSVEKVDAGSKLVDQAGATMQEVVQAISRVTDIVSEISAASAEQTTGIEQVQQAVMQMDQTTQQNSALVEESAAASESLREQAEKLTQVVSVFRVAAQPASAYGAPTAPVAVRQPKAPQPATAAARTPEEPLQVKRLASAGTGGDWEEF
jgi:methyl-accepting chemotaxis protein